MPNKRDSFKKKLKDRRNVMVIADLACVLMNALDIDYQEVIDVLMDRRKAKIEDS